MWVLDVRPDIAFATEELARVGSPTEADGTRLVHLARYLQGTQDGMLKLGTVGEAVGRSSRTQTRHGRRAQVDARLRSGGIVTYAGVILTSRSRTQERLALSSCEARHAGTPTSRCTQETTVCLALALRRQLLRAPLRSMYKQNPM